MRALKPRALDLGRAPGSTEDLVSKLADYEHSDLPERTKAALRLADRLSGERPVVDRVRELQAPRVQRLA